MRSDEHLARRLDSDDVGAFVLGPPEVDSLGRALGQLCHWVVELGVRQAAKHADVGDLWLLAIETRVRGLGRRVAVRNDVVDVDCVLGRKPPERKADVGLEESCANAILQRSVGALSYRVLSVDASCRGGYCSEDVVLDEDRLARARLDALSVAYLPVGHCRLGR